MAEDLTSNPLLFDAVAQSIASHVKVTSVCCITGGVSGEFVLLDEAGGRELVRVPSINANTESWIHCGGWFKGVYVQALPSGGKVKVYYE
jgi:hypothetical protein